MGIARVVSIRTRETASKAIKLYDELRTIDWKLRALRAKKELQKVVFYLQEGGYSGPVEYTPVCKAQEIIMLIDADLLITRHVLSQEITALGFKAPEFSETPPNNGT